MCEADLTSLAAHESVERALRLGLVVRVKLRGQSLHALSDRGLALFARRNRLAVPAVLGCWSPMPISPAGPPAWRRIRGTRTRRLARDIHHTAAVHGFLAAMAE